MKLPRPINAVIDAGGLAVALAVDLVLNIICFLALAPDPLTKVAFVAIGIMIVLFVLRSWSKRQFALYAVFVCVVFFFDYSYTLEATRAQATEVTTQSDTELSRISSQLTDATASLDDLHDQYDRAMRAETLRELNAQITTTQERIDQYNADYKTRLQEIESGEHSAVHITSSNVFMAVYNAAKEGRYVQMVVYAFVFAGLQFIVASSVDNSGKPARRKTAAKKKTSITGVSDKPITPVITAAPDIVITNDDIEQFVKWSWYKNDRGMGSEVMSQEMFFGVSKKQGKEFERGKYTKLLKACKDAGLVSETGKILQENKKVAINVLSRENRRGKV